MSEIGQHVRNARRCSTPLVAINTPDPAATIKAVCAATALNPPATVPPNGPPNTPAETTSDADPIAKVAWDFVQGMVGLNDAGRAWVTADGGGTENSPFAALLVARKLPEGALLFIHLTPYWIAEPAYIQAAWNLRDAFKANQRMLVFLAKQLTLPAELSDDVTVFDEPLPTEAELGEIVARQHKNAGLAIDETTRGKAVEALRGLSAFSAEQVTAMSLRKSGLDLDRCWERKRQQIEQTPGLKVFRGGESFDQIGGCGVVKEFLTRVLHGQARPNAVVFVDEIEKMLGGRGDLTGVSQDQLGGLLSYMQDNAAAGMIFIGPPGAAKSAVAKAAGNEAGIPTVQLDLGSCKGSLVGQSEQQLRTALKVITAVSNGRSLWIATCNAIAELPPELRRRFTLGTFFFDLPTAEERNAIWAIYAKKYQIEMFRPDPSRTDSIAVVNPPPSDEGWTGAEIKQCCDIAWRLGCTLTEAAAFVVPVSRSAADKLDALRLQADGRFLSASVPGVYQRKCVTTATPAGRAIQLDD